MLNKLDRFKHLINNNQMSDENITSEISEIHNKSALDTLSSAIPVWAEFIGITKDGTLTSFDSEPDLNKDDGMFDSLGDKYTEHTSIHLESYPEFNWEDSLVKVTPSLNLCEHFYEKGLI